MKKVLLPLALLLSTQAFGQALSQVPFYFAVTEEAHFPLKDSSWKKIPVKGIETDKAYLRGFHFADTSAAGRRKAFNELLKKEVIQTGDIVLSFRPAWEDTVPYSHMQMGVSHASLVVVENGTALNIDMPLDGDYNGPGDLLAGKFDSKHFIETNHYQIIRPRNFGPKKANLKAWTQELRKNLKNIRATGLMKFNPDYQASKIDKYGAGSDSFITTMARLLKGQDTTSTDLTMFCSEFVWALLSLSNCTPADAEIANPSVTNASCIQHIFKPQTYSASNGNPGLTEGPLAVLKELDVSDSEKQALLETLFIQGKMDGLSSGHRALATNPQISALIGALKMIYPAKLAGKDASVAKVTSTINAKGGRNYSPTSFVINSMLDERDPARAMDYVGTVSFGK